MLEGCVCSKHRVIRLNNRRRQLRCWVHAELELRLFTVVRREPLEQEGTEARSSTATKGVENKEALEATTVVRKSADLVHGRVDKLLSNSVVAACICRPIRVRINTN